MTTFKDFLIWYNNLDVEPFLQASEKQTMIFKSKGIDMLKSAISLPGLAVRWMFALTNDCEIDSSAHGIENNLQPVMLLDESSKDLYKLFREHLVGGPSIIFHRYHEKSATRLREAELGEEARDCQQILGVDANTLYLWCTVQNLPTGHPIRREVDNEFTPTRGSN